MVKPTTIDSFFKKKDVQHSEVNTSPSASNLDNSVHDHRPPKSPRIESMEVDTNILERDLGLRRPIWDYPINQDDRLRLKVSIDVIRWLAFQACAFGVNDESADSNNRGNFIEMIKLFASCNEKVDKVVLENAPANAKFTSLDTQKEILHIFANRVRYTIREQIGDAKFCLILGEVQDAYDEEGQMAIILRFVDKDGFIRERFFDLVHVCDTTTLTLKDEISAVLSRYNLNIQNIRGQGYDGISNMRGEWNGLQALFLNDCPFAYYVHCLAHCLQLPLVTASREVIPVFQFFKMLGIIINIIGDSPKPHDELQAAQVEDIVYLLSINEIDFGTEPNEMGTLQRPGDTRSGSHYKSICSFINMFSGVCKVLENMIDDVTCAERGKADGAYDVMTSFEFIFILHLVKEIMGITNDLCQALQQKSLDILNAMRLVSSTKKFIQELRECGWDSLIEKVKSFCDQHNIELPDMNSQYTARRGRSWHHQVHVTIEHHYRVDIFTATIDFQLKELNSRFNENIIELLVLSSALDPKDGYKLFKTDDILKLVNKFYPQDFSNQEKIDLEYQLRHYHFDVTQHPGLKEASTIAELCQKLVATGKSVVYPLIDRLIRLVMTLPISMATTERAFSAMKIVKTRLRNKMDDIFLADCLITYIEREIAEEFSVDSIIDDFKDMKERRLRLK